VEEIKEHSHKWYKFGCKDATFLMDKADYVSLSFSEKSLLSFHKLMCKYCRRYNEQMLKVKLFFRTEAKSSKTGLSGQKKQALNQLITENLKN
jgi:hypothetical protein